jgi:hypothetical protein
MTSETEALAVRVRKILARRRGISEKRMFGGVCFLLRGHMLCASSSRGFMFRVGKAQHARAVARRGASPMVMNGRKFEGFVRVDPGACDFRGLKHWIALADGYVSTLPPKK